MELDFRKTERIHPSYKYDKLTGDLGQSFTITNANRISLKFKLPRQRVPNFTHSKAHFTITPTASGNATLFNILQVNGIMPIYQINLLNQHGKEIIGTTNLNKYSNMTFRPNLSYNRVNNFDSVDHQGLLPPSNNFNTVLYDDITFTFGAVTGVTIPGADDPPTNAQINTAFQNLTTNINTVFKQVYYSIWDLLKYRFTYDLMTDIEFTDDPYNATQFNAYGDAYIAALEVVFANITDTIDAQFNTALTAITFTAFSAADTARATLQAQIDAFIAELNDATPSSETGFQLLEVELSGSDATLTSNAGLYSNSFLRSNQKPNFAYGTKYNECLYQVYGTGNTATPVQTYNFELGLYRDTFLGANKDLFFGKNEMTLEIIFSLPNEIYYLSDGTVYNANIAVTNCFLELAYENNPVIYKDVVDHFEKEGLSISIPYLEHNKLTLTTASNTINYRQIFNKSKSNYIYKIYASVYNATETGYTGYERYNNISSIDDKVNSYDVRQFALNTANEDEFREVYNKLKGSSILSMAEFYYNHTYVLDFTDTNYIDADYTNVIDGYKLDDKENKQLIYDLNITCNSSALWNLYVFSVVQRNLIINNSGISLL